MEGQRDEGTEGRRDRGMKGQRNGGMEEQRDEGTDGCWTTGDHIGTAFTEPKTCDLKFPI